MSGPVAQLGARFNGIEEVVGSIPTRSTTRNRQMAVSCFNLAPAAYPTLSFDYLIIPPPIHIKSYIIYMRVYNATSP